MAAREAQTASKDNQPTALPLKDSDGEDVTYVPGPGEAADTKWRGRSFRALQPKRIKDPDHLEAARNNPYFHVGPFDPAKHGQPKVTNLPAPTDGRSYRAHVVAWLKTCSTAEQLISRWATDQRVRDLCEDIGTEDYMAIGPLIDARLAELMASDDVPPDRAAAKEISLCQRYGVTSLPWRGGARLAVGMTEMR